jgi:polysaccharide export outer membrane protein
MKFKRNVFFLGLVSLIMSCDTYKNIPYFQNLPDDARVNILKPKYSNLIIAPDDILSINIATLDPQSSAILSQSLGPQTQSSLSSLTSPSSTPSQPQTSGFLVNKDGDIEYPVLGKFHLEGLTTEEAQNLIESKALQIFKTPAVYVRFANFKITVLGEVQKPGTYVLPNEKVTIFDALGLAGDLTIFGKRENVLLVRDSVDHTQLIRLNLNSKEIIQSDYYYLKKNDVIYVEPTKQKLANLDATKNRNYAIFAAILSVLIIAATRIK